jgi:hypothetical protein
MILPSPLVHYDSAHNDQRSTYELFAAALEAGGDAIMLAVPKWSF